MGNPVDDPPIDARETHIKIGWVTGFVDGEGCFSISFIRQQGGGSRAAYCFGYQVAHEFAVTQSAKSIGSLQELERFFGIGQLIASTRHDNHKDMLCRYVVRKRQDLQGTIIPFFEDVS